MSLFFSLLLIFVYEPIFAQDWKWTGFEVIGNHKVSKAEILMYIPIKARDLYKEDPESWQKWCTDLKNHFRFYFTHCSAVRYINFQAFFVVDIVEEGYEYRNQFKANPNGSVPLASQEILVLYEKLYKRLQDLFNQGVGFIELSDNNYLDYSDKEMHEIALQLIKLVPKYRGNLIAVIEKDKDVNKREKAANLLNWTIHDLSDSMVRVSHFLDDPSSLVRNNISRFTLHFISKVQVQKKRQDLIDHFLLQLDRPSHGDRNKAIYNLLEIATIFSIDRPYIKAQGLSLIEYTAKTSILNNVRDPALELLKLINEDNK